MDFFSTCDSRNYFAGIDTKISNDISGISDEEIINCDLEEWKDYFYDKYYIDPIVIFEDNIEQVLAEKKVKQYNHWHRYDSDEKKFYNVDGYSISYKIYYDGNADLFELKPSTWIMSNFSCASFERPKNENCGSFILEFSYTKHQLHEKKNLQEFVKKDFENEFKSYKTMIHNVNQEVNSYNSSLNDKIMNLLVARKEKASMFATLSKELEIPMVVSATAPNIKPVTLKRINLQTTASKT